MLSGIPLTFDSGEVVFSEGDAAADMYLIRSGNVRIESGAKGAIATLSPGDFFGEMALFEPGPRNATAWCESPVELEVIDRPTLMASVDDPEVKEMVAIMAKRIRELDSAE
jgi:CRP-like cAMP-binding protein